MMCAAGTAVGKLDFVERRNQSLGRSTIGKNDSEERPRLSASQSSPCLLVGTKVPILVFDLTVPSLVY
jgi:hypothetical protein